MTVLKSGDGFRNQWNRRVKEIGKIMVRFPEV